MTGKAHALKLSQTGDGSSSLYHEGLDETYHSRHGAIAESKHVFIDQGLTHRLKIKSTRHLSILEMGFGTGLNALLTLLYLQDDLQEQFEFENKNISFSVNYDALEAFPLTPDHYQNLDYPKHLNSPDALFRKLHEVPWDLPNEISKGFTLFKQNRHFEDFVADQAYDLVYYDAFGARVQPELWEIERFLALYKALRPHGVLVTYAAKGSVRRALQEVGFMVERLPGPPGKREMLRGTKI